MRVPSNQFKRKDGAISIDAVLSLSVVLMIFIALLGLFLAIYPRIMLLQEMHSITRLAEMQGGLTSENIQFFEERIGDYGFVSNSAGVEIKVVTESGLNAGEIDEKGTENPFYIKREDFDAMQVFLNVPVDNSVLKSALSFFSVNGELGDYGFQEIVYSERY